MHKITTMAAQAPPIILGFLCDLVLTATSWVVRGFGGGFAVAVAFGAAASDAGIVPLPIKNDWIFNTVKGSPLDLDMVKLCGVAPVSVWLVQTMAPGLELLPSDLGEGIVVENSLSTKNEIFPTRFTAEIKVAIKLIEVPKDMSESTFKHMKQPRITDR